MGTKWRYPIEDNYQSEEIIAEIVSHAISRIELLNGKDSMCIAEEYKEWLGEDYDNDVMVLDRISKKL